MKKDSDFYEYVLHDLFSEIEDISSRRMFGGYGFYQDGVFFAIMYTDNIYFKVDEKNKPDYEKHNSKPFVYSKKNKEVTLSFWRLPGDIMEDRKQLEEWVHSSVAAARRAKK